MAAVTAVLLLIGAAGCSGHPPYPQTWPSLNRASHVPCSGLAGTYANKGEAFDQRAISIVEMLLPETGWHSADTVTLSFPQPDRLDFVLAEGSKTTSRSLLRRSGQFSCEAYSLVIHANTESEHGFRSPAGDGGPGPIPVVMGTAVHFKLQLVEGYLVITRQDVDFMWLPFPGRSTWSSWYRFQRIGQ